jgi:tetratricopeptide (TPR) repeat protein
MKLQNNLILAYNHGLFLAQRGCYASAEYCFHQVLAEDPRYVPAYVLLGKIKMHEGKYTEALAFFKEVASTNGHTTPLYERCVRMTYGVFWCKVILIGVAISMFSGLFLAWVL